MKEIKHNSVVSNATKQPVTATGKLPFRLTNDYLFRALFQKRPKALEGLCRAVLQIPPEDHVLVTIQNPIELGNSVDAKELILDLEVLINNYTLLNLEMQVYRDPFWIDRSLAYLTRMFDNLNQGDHYDEIHPAIHVGFLDYTLFPEHPEFFSTYQLLNTKNHEKYSDKIRISVVDLNHIELATDEDKTNSLDLWAQTFKATTWEEITMLSNNNEYLQDAVSGIRQLTEDEKIRRRIQDRETKEYWERMRIAHMEKQDRTILQNEKIIQQQDETIQQQAETIQQKDEIIAKYQALYGELN